MRTVRIALVMLSTAGFGGGALASCGGDAGSDLQDAGRSEAAPVNACGGAGPLQFAGTAAMPGQPCGPCGDGALACGSLDVLVCVGASAASECRDAQPRNACGGTQPLSYMQSAATPGQECGPCQDGVLLCASPDTLACIGASPRASCAHDASADVQLDSTLDQDAEGAIDAGVDASTEAGLDAASDVMAEAGSDATTDAPIEASLDAALDAGTDADAAPPCIIPSSAFTLPAPPSPTLPPETQPTSTTFTTLPLVANDLVFDAYNGLLYASVPSAQGPGGNSIAVIDPTQPAVLQTVYVGSEPDVLALSDDGKTIWVGLDGADAIRRFDVGTATPGLQFSLSLAATASSIAILPGTEDSVAVATSARRVFIYDEGVARPYGVIDKDVTVVTATYSPALLYAVDGTSLGALYTVCVNASGAFVTRTDEPFAAMRTFANGVLYGDDGMAFDIATYSVLGTYTDKVYPQSLAADPATSRVFILDDNQTSRVQTYDMTTFVPLATDSFNVPPSTTKLVRWGRYGLAFRSNDGASVVIARSANIPPKP